MVILGGTLFTDNKDVLLHLVNRLGTTGDITTTCHDSRLVQDVRGGG